MNNNNENTVENPFLLPEIEENPIQPAQPVEPSVQSNDIPRWPAGPPTKTKGEFGAGDKAHQERAKAEGKALGHPAIDIVYPIGTPIYAMLPGKVIRVSNEERPYRKGDSKEGNSVKIDHPNYGFTSFYAHLSSVNVSPGQEVNQNTQIGTIGTSGNAAGTAQEIDGIPYGHVHFAVTKNNIPVNPRSIIKGMPIEKKAFNRVERMNIIVKMIKEAELKSKAWEDEDD